MAVCYSCKNDLSERGLYCSKCGIRTKCAQCRSLIEANDKFCVDCGTGIDVSPQSIGLSQSDQLDGVFNVITYNEDTRSRSFNARLSDSAFENGSEVLGLLLANRMGSPVRRGRQANGNYEVLEIQEDLPSIADEPIELIPSDAPKSPPKVLTDGSEESLLSSIFRGEGNNLRVANSRLKQKSKSDFVSRVTVVFLYAHELAGRNSVDREEIKKLLQDNKVYDGNSRAWLANSDYFSRDNSNYELSVPGREFAKEVLIEFADENIDTHWMVGTKGKSRKGAKGDDASEIEGKTGRGRKATGSGFRSQVTKLFKDGFFKDAKTNIAAKDELIRRGYKFELNRINEALITLTKKESLTREQNEADDWLYKNK